MLVLAAPTAMQYGAFPKAKQRVALALQSYGWVQVRGRVTPPRVWQSRVLTKSMGLDLKFLL